MKDTLKNLDLLDPWVKDKVTPFGQKLLETFPGRIKSISLYGSAAVGDHIPKRSDINLMVMIDHLAMEDLRRSIKLVKWGKKRRVSAPLFLTPDHITNSVDAFPMEFLEMKEKHITLYGQDPFTNLYIDPKNLRLQCEQQIKGKLIRLRQTYLEIGYQKRPLRLLLTASLTTLLPTIRNAIRLLYPKTELPKNNEEVIKKMSSVLHLDETPFLEILQMKKGIHKPGKAQTELIFKAYLEGLTTLAEKIDQ